MKGPMFLKITFPLLCELCGVVGAMKHCESTKMLRTTALNYCYFPELSTVKKRGGRKER